MRCAVVVLLLSIHASLWGQTYTVLNPGFETEVLADGTSTALVPSWTKIGTSVTLNPTAAMLPGEAPEGQNVWSVSNTATFITQGLGILQPGTYTLQGKVGLLTAGVFNGLNFTLRGNTTILVESSFSKPIPAPGTFDDWSITYVVLPTNANAITIGSNLNILAISGATAGTSAVLDDVRLSFVAVPEPTSYALVTITLLAGLLVERSRRQKIQQSI
jgi:hypothetical protein